MVFARTLYRFTSRRRRELGCARSLEPPSQFIDTADVVVEGFHAAHFIHEFRVPCHDALGGIFAVAQMPVDEGSQLNRDGAGRTSKLLLQRRQVRGCLRQFSAGKVTPQMFKHLLQLGRVPAQLLVRRIGEDTLRDRWQMSIVVCGQAMCFARVHGYQFDLAQRLNATLNCRDGKKPRELIPAHAERQHLLV